MVKHVLMKIGIGIAMGILFFSLFLFCLSYVFDSTAKAVCVSLILTCFMQLLFYMYVELVYMNNAMDKEYSYEDFKSDFENYIERYMEENEMGDDGFIFYDSSSSHKSNAPEGYTHKVSFDAKGNIIKNDEQQCCKGTGENCHCNNESDTNKDKTE